MRLDEVAWLTAGQVAERVRAGDLDPAEAVRVHLDRIERLNPRLNAYLHVDPAAAPADGPLRGATLAVKDTQPVAGMPWTYGSRRWRDLVAQEDAVPVRRARAAGLARRAQERVRADRGEHVGQDFAVDGDQPVIRSQRPRIIAGGGALSHLSCFL